MRIRKFKDSDARSVSYLIRKALVEVNSRYYPKCIIDNLLSINTPAKIIARSKAKEVFVITEKGHVLGTGNLGPTGIGTVFINPRYRKKGLGRKLMLFLEKRARENGLITIELPSSIGAVGFYSKLGYLKIRARVSKKYGKTILMRKELL